jgi:hypothetical protein
LIQIKDANQWMTIKLFFDGQLRGTCHAQMVRATGSGSRRLAYSASCGVALSALLLKLRADAL